MYFFLFNIIDYCIFIQPFANVLFVLKFSTVVDLQQETRRNIDTSDAPDQLIVQIAITPTYRILRREVRNYDLILIAAYVGIQYFSFTFMY